MNRFVDKRQLLIVVMFFAFILSSYHVYGTDFSSKRLRLCNLNSDNYLDTVHLDTDNNLSSIIWGDSLSQGSHQTFFKYPKENLIKCKYSLINFDNDTINDIYINIKYKSGDFDSTYHYIILNQESLSLIDTVTLDTNIITPGYLEYYAGMDSIFTGGTLFTPGSMKALTFRHVERNIAVPGIIPSKTSLTDNVNLKEPKIEIYPSPSTDHFKFKLDNFTSGVYNYEITNMLNQPVLRDKVYVSGSFFSKDVNLQSLSSGIYSFKIYNDNLVLNKLVIIIK